jgi:hypothetical protein
MGILGALAVPVASWALRQSGLLRQRKSAGERAAQAQVGQRVDALDALGGQYGQDAEFYRNRTRAGEAETDNALQSYLDELTRPRTEQTNTALARAGEGIGQDRERATSRLASTLARAGVSDSSAAAGGQAALESAAAGRMAAFRDNLAQREADRAENNRKTIVQLVAQRLARNQSAGNAATRGQIGIQSGLLGQARQDQGLERQDAMQSDMGLGSLAEIIGQVLARRRAPKAGV